MAISIVMLRFMNLPHFDHLSLRFYDDAFEHARDSNVMQGGAKLHSSLSVMKKEVSYLLFDADKMCEIYFSSFLLAPELSCQSESD